MADKWKQTALLVMGMQKDYVLEDGLMRLKGAKAIVPNVIKAVEIARQRGILIVWVVREHDYCGRDVELFRRSFYCPEKGGPATKGSEGAELVDGLEIRKVKTRFSAFFDTNLHTFLQSNGVNNLVVIGIQTPNCIRQTVFDAVAHNYPSVTVIVDATAAATPKDAMVVTLTSLLDDMHYACLTELQYSELQLLFYIDIVIDLCIDVELFRRRNFTPGGGPATKGTEGAELVDGLDIKIQDYKLVKTRFSAFFNTNLHTFLQSNGINNLVVTGFQTPNCIRQTVFDAVEHDYHSVTVIADATAAATPEVHEANLFDMRNIEVATPTLEEWAAETNMPVDMSK
ncbi:Isochorismatase-like protein [Corchorus capsularis]|uniref:Isochorismatase-like protein n=1 Tax=Corchorus capsularis TaxID=210143 RepID=A0A1R3G7L0_COCAP|nr:Isochorismatase-like protein [Corchorus capsularis]